MEFTTPHEEMSHTAGVLPVQEPVANQKDKARHRGFAAGYKNRGFSDGVVSGGGVGNAAAKSVCSQCSALQVRLEENAAEGEQQQAAVTKAQEQVASLQKVHAQTNVAR